MSTAGDVKVSLLPRGATVINRRRRPRSGAAHSEACLAVGRRILPDTCTENAFPCFLLNAFTVRRARRPLLLVQPLRIADRSDLSGFGHYGYWQDSLCPEGGIRRTGSVAPNGHL